jgi:hypothetical protein
MDFNKLKCGKLVPDFLLPMLSALDITPSLVSQKESTVLYNLLCEPLSLGENNPRDPAAVFDSNQFICFLAAVSNFFIDSKLSAFKSNAHILLSRIELSKGFKSFIS